VFFDSDKAAGALAARLFDEGIVVAPVGPPYVAAGTSRLRIIASAAHYPPDVRFAIEAFARALDAGRPTQDDHRSQTC
jgi:7-keto-8-aminopelargonate synthetase-like enzyme